MLQGYTWDLGDSEQWTDTSSSVAGIQVEGHIRTKFLLGHGYYGDIINNPIYCPYICLKKLSGTNNISAKVADKYTSRSSDVKNCAG